MLGPASAIKRELDNLVQLQINVLKREESLSMHEINEYQDRAARIKTLTEELDRDKPVPRYSVIRKHFQRQAS